MFSVRISSWLVRFLFFGFFYFRGVFGVEIRFIYFGLRFDIFFVGKVFCLEGNGVE